MQKKQMLFKTKGMNQDLSVSSFNPEFSFENVNLRLSTNEGNTLMSWVNEKGTEEVKLFYERPHWHKEGENDYYGDYTLDAAIYLTPSVEWRRQHPLEPHYSSVEDALDDGWSWDMFDESNILGTPIGTAVINHKLVVFTTSSSFKDNIYVIYKIKAVREHSKGVKDEEKEYFINAYVYKGNLNFHHEYPLETLVSYESETVEKVYWTDNYNLPRMANIVLLLLFVKENNNIPISFNDETFADTRFDFVSATNLDSTITVDKVSGGVFAPGVILYCYTYYNENAQLSNIVNVSPLNYITFNTRGAKLDEVVNASFKITITKPDRNFDKVRLYSIQRTSLNTTPLVKILEDFPIVRNDNAGNEYTNDIIYTDTGTSGISIDPTELLFIGGKEILALTMCEKDLTLFLGNITQKNDNVSVIQEWVDKLDASKKQIHFDRNKYFELNNPDGTLYSNTFTLNHNRRKITTFKGGDWYRFGFQLLKYTGEWTDPIFIKDAQNPNYPSTNINTEEIYLARAYAEFDLSSIESVVPNFRNLYKRIRPLIVYPDIWDREVLCQGVLNPTVFNVEDRKERIPYSLASWFFRPYSKYAIASETKENVITITPPGTRAEEDDEQIPYVPNPYLSSESLASDNTGSENSGGSDSSDGGGSGNSNTESQTNSESSSNSADVRPNLYSIALLRINIKHVGHYLKYGIDIDKGNGWSKEIYPYYGALKLGSVMLNKDNAETEFWDMLFWVPIKNIKKGDGDYEKDSNQNDERYYYIEGGVTKEAAADMYFDMHKSFTLEGHCWGAPWDIDLDDLQVMGWTYTRVYPLPESIERDACGMLTYTGDLESVSFSFEFKEDDFVKFGGNEGPYNNFIGVYKVTLHKDEGIGNTLIFKHYNSLYNQSDHELEIPVGNEGNKWKPWQTTDDSGHIVYYNDNGGVRPKSVEIQASVTKYDTPYDEENNNTENTNSLFFVDQSIVTLNSPDLEFDTSVSGYIPESAKLRIVGVIPITASASAHNITTSSAMVPIGYETEEDLFGRIHESTGFGKGELDINTYWVNKNINAGKRLVSEYIWEDALPSVVNDKVVSSLKTPVKFLVYPWLASKSLNGDKRGAAEASSVLKTKVISNIAYSCNTSYISPYDFKVGGKIKNVGVLVHLKENEFIENLRLPKLGIGQTDNINYYANIDKALINDLPWRTYAKSYTFDKLSLGAVLMRYKSNTHAVITLPEYSNDDTTSTIFILPYLNLSNVINVDNLGEYVVKLLDSNNSTFWGDKLTFKLEGLNLNNGVFERNGFYDTLLLGELYLDVNTDTIFGGKGELAIKANKWIVGGEVLPIKLNDDNTIKPITLTWTEGDTYFQRYDCLKTYPFSDLDPNQIVEILSFMCETHVNLDGRYDRNRGLRDNTIISPVNFNLMNDVYNQKDNFFIYSKTDGNERFPNLITYTKTKESGADIDQWTNITLASNLELDGSKGEITSLLRVNSQLFAFLDTGISQILYNENVQIASTEGVPIEIANSQKVQGKRYYSNSIGCSNKYSICNTPSGIYFIDSNDKGIYLFNGELTNLSNKFGFNTWCKNNIVFNKDISWNPESFDDFVTYYDKQNHDVLFINKDKCLAFSEKLGAFTSFYSYNNAPYFCNLDDIGLWINKDNNKDNTEDEGFYKLWKHRGGKYCSFFGEDNKPYSITLISNPEPLIDKMFTNLEFRANVDNDGESKAKGFIFHKPFDSIEAWNDYQHGKNTLDALDGKIGNYWYKHNSSNAKESLKRNFRIWRCDIPRDNYEFMTLPVQREGESIENYKIRVAAYNKWLSGEHSKGIFRYGRKPNDRMRNPWIYLKLAKDNNTNKRTEIHDVVMTYFE